MKLNKSMKTTQRLAAALTIALTGTVAQGASAIYESFADSDASLVNNATGTGLTGNWTGDSRPDIVSSNLTYGSLETSGNAVFANNAWYANSASIDMTNTAYTGLQTHGGEMWFSMLYRKDTGNGRFYFTIGSDGLSNNGNLADGQAIGFGSTGSNIYAGLWASNAWGATNLGGPAATSVDVNNDSNIDSGDSGTLAGETTYLIVGHAQWGANGAANDTVTLYLPGTDLTLGSAVAQSVGVVDQSTFDLINTNHGNGLSSRWDEIRIGATYADVSPVPEPTTTALLGLGGLALILRRRR